MAEIIAKTFDKLPVDAAAIRRDVFMVEQGYAEEFDEIDDRAVHIVLYDAGAPVAACRVFEEAEGYYIGRLAAVDSRRGQGLGSRILQEAEKVIRSRGGKTVILSARCAARPFYEKYGYRACGEVYRDEGQPHIEMRKELV